MESVGARLACEGANPSWSVDRQHGSWRRSLGPLRRPARLSNERTNMTHRTSLSAGAVGMAALCLVALTGVPADAAWSSVDQVNNAHAYACKVVHPKRAAATVRFYVDARNSNRWVGATVGVSGSNGAWLRSASVRAGAGAKSGTNHVWVTNTQAKQGRLLISLHTAKSGSVDPLSLARMKAC